MIYIFQPFSLDKNTHGDTLNAHCEIVPNDEDWILLLDYDAMILSTKTYNVIHKAIENNPEAKIFGAMTNRIGLHSHLLGKNPDPNDEIKRHIAMAEKLADQFPNGECKLATQCPGFFMLFRKAYWKEVGGFQKPLINEHGLLFDLAFSRHAKDGNSARIIKGAYIWHSYRIMKGQNWANKDHLR